METISWLLPASLLRNKSFIYTKEIEIKPYGHSSFDSLSLTQGIQLLES